MNFDDDDELDFSFGATSDAGNKLASLFNMNAGSENNESLKHKAPKQPQQVIASSVNQNQQITSSKSSVKFFTNVQAFKYLNNRHEPQGKLGLAILSNQNTYKLLLYATKTQPAAIVTIGNDFKIALQKNNYASFYDEHRQLWSVLFDTEDLVSSFATNVVLCKINLMVVISPEVGPIKQDLNLNETDGSIKVESNDSIEIETVITLYQDGNLGSVIENTEQKPSKLRLGKGKLSKNIEELFLNMKSGDKKLFVSMGKQFFPSYSSLIAPDSIVFYQVKILRIKKNEKKERTLSNASTTVEQIPLPQLSPVSQISDDSRIRTDSIKDKSKVINNQLSESKLDKAKLISRIAKMGQQMLPKNDAEVADELNAELEGENWETNTEKQNLDGLDSTQNTKTYLLQQQQQRDQQLFQQQQQMVSQNQLLQQQAGIYQMQQRPPHHQLALVKNNSAYNPQVMIYPQQSIPPSVEAMQTQPQQISASKEHTREFDESNSKILFKLELLSDKLDNLKSIASSNQQNMPSMDTNILLSNIQRIVKENEQYKKELYEKGNKIEELNTKITDLLMKAQTYVEQSHLILEQKNTSFQFNSEKNAHRVLELEQDKMQLTGDLSKLTAQISELNIEINRMQKTEAENKSHLIEISKNTDSYKQNSERLVVENAELQAKLDTCIVEYKKEKQLRKTVEAQVSFNDDEISELRTSLLASQKHIEDKKKKFDLDRARFDLELDELKQSHAIEINDLTDKINKLKTKAMESIQQQMKQSELELNNEWQIKLDKTALQLEQKHERQIALLREEVNNTSSQLVDAKEFIKKLKSNVSRFEAESDELKQKIDDLSLVKEKYERLQNQAIIMKGKFENRIKELLESEPDPEVIGEEVKRVMNSIYRQIKIQIRPEHYYSGNGILMGMLKIIKIYTIRVLQQMSEDDDEDAEKYDLFSQHIYMPDSLKTLQSQASIEVLKDTNTKPLEKLSIASPNVVIPKYRETQPNADIENFKMEPVENKNSELVQSKKEEKDNLEEQTAKEIASRENIDLNSANSEVEYDKGLSISQIPNKIIDSSDEDGDDKSIQAINDEEQTETELLLNRPIMRSSVVTSDVLSDNLEINLPQVQNLEETNKENKIEVNDEEMLSKAGNIEVEDEEDDDIDVYEKAITNRKSSVSQSIEPQILNEETKVELEPTFLTVNETELNKEENSKTEKIDETEKSSKSKFESRSIEDKIESTEIVDELNLDEKGNDSEKKEPREGERTCKNVITEKHEIASKKVKIPDMSKGLFDDSEDEDEEEDGLFSFSSNKSKTPTPVNFEVEGLVKSQIISSESSTIPKTVNLKFSPPPLFEDDDNNDKEEIDWFK